VLQLDWLCASDHHLCWAAGRDGPLRELTDIEESIWACVEIVCRELRGLGSGGPELHFERRQMQTQVARIMSVAKDALPELRDSHAAVGLLNLAFPAWANHSAPADLRLGRRRRHAGRPVRMEQALRRIRLAAPCILPPFGWRQPSRAWSGHGAAPRLAANTLPEGRWAPGALRAQPSGWIASRRPHREAVRRLSMNTFLWSVGWRRHGLFSQVWQET